MAEQTTRGNVDCPVCGEELSYLLTVKPTFDDLTFRVGFQLEAADLDAHILTHQTDPLD